MNKFLKISIFCLILYSLFLIPQANAAKLYFERPVDDIHQNDVFEVILKLDPQKEEINAVEGRISFSDNLILRNINDGNSFLTLWVERPILQDDNVVFAGVVPGGYLGDLGPYWSGHKAGMIFTLILEAAEKGQSWLKMENITVLLNDGEGTQISPEIENVQFSVAETKGGRTILKEADLYSDDEPPEHFIPHVAQDKNVFDGKYFLVFNTQDKSSGIYYYKVKEGNKDFEIAESPYLLKNQKLDDDIIVQAVDRAGNVREEKLEAVNKKPFYLNIGLLIIIITIALFVPWIYKRKLYTK